MIDRRYLLAPIDEDDDFLMDAEYVELESDLREYSVESDEFDDQERAEVVIATLPAPAPAPTPAMTAFPGDLDFEPIPDIIDSAPILAAAAAATRSVVGPVTVVRRAPLKKPAPVPAPTPVAPPPAKKKAAPAPVKKAAVKKAVAKKAPAKKSPVKAAPAAKKKTAPKKPAPRKAPPKKKPAAKKKKR